MLQTRGQLLFLHPRSYCVDVSNGQSGPGKHGTILVTSKIREAPAGPEPISFNMLTFPLSKMVWETSGSERHWIFLNFFLWGPAPLLPFAACRCCQEIEDRGWKALGLLGTIWQQGQWDEQLSPCTAGSHLSLTPLQYWGGRTLIFRFPELCQSLLI